MDNLSALLDAQIDARGIPLNSRRAALVSTLQRQIEEAHEEPITITDSFAGEQFELRILARTA